MRALFRFLAAFIILFLFTGSRDSSPEFLNFTKEFYTDLGHPELDFDAFHKGISGYYYLLSNNKLKNTRYLSIADLSKSANVERYYLIDMINKSMVKKSLIAHGKNTGDEYAKYFSNIVSSNQTSLGFYSTAETYNGCNGLSMRMDGLEYCNNKARERAIVVHKADYVSHDFIKENGRLGRSFGCPALPIKGYEKTINKIKNGSCFFIYYTDNKYFQKSQILKKSAKININQNGEILL